MTFTNFLKKLIWLEGEFWVWSCGVWTLLDFFILEWVAGTSKRNEVDGTSVAVSKQVEGMFSNPFLDFYLACGVSSTHM
jgi:hypothetical protein